MECTGSLKSPQKEVEYLSKQTYQLPEQNGSMGQVAPSGDGLWREAHLRCSLGQKETLHKILRDEHLDFSFFCHIPISFIGESVSNPQAGIPVSQDKDQSRREGDGSENKQRNSMVMGATGVMRESESPGGWGLCGRSLCRAWFGFGQISRSLCHP